MKDPTCHHAIINLLKTRDGLTKESIVRQIPYKFNTVSKALTQLGHAELVRQFKGTYFITEVGRDLPDNFGFHYFKDAANGNGNDSSRDFWLEQFNLDFVRSSSMCKWVCTEFDAEGMEHWINIWTPFVLAFLRINGQELPIEFDADITSTPNDEDSLAVWNFAAERLSKKKI